MINDFTTKNTKDAKNGVGLSTATANGTYREGHHETHEMDERDFVNHEE